jgi:hypothetical protein
MSVQGEKAAQDEKLLNEDDPLLTPKGVVEDLGSVGLITSPSWFEKLVAAGKGPPIDGYWGRTPMRKRSRVRKWAEERMKSGAGRPNFDPTACNHPRAEFRKQIGSRAPRSAAKPAQTGRAT